MLSFNNLSIYPTGYSARGIVVRAVPAQRHPMVHATRRGQLCSLLCGRAYQQSGSSRQQQQQQHWIRQHYQQCVLVDGSIQTNGARHSLSARHVVPFQISAGRSGRVCMSQGYCAIPSGDAWPKGSRADREPAGSGAGKIQIIAICSI